MASWQVLVAWYRATPWARNAAIFVAATVVAAGIGQLAPRVFDLGRAPYRITSEANPDRIQIDGQIIGNVYVVDRPISEVGPPPGRVDKCEGRFGWAMSMNAVQGDAAEVLFRVENTGTSPIQIMQVDVKVDKREPSLKGTELLCPGRGAPVQDRAVFADLSSDPVRVDISNTSADGPVSHYEVPPGQSESFNVTGQALSCLCSWHIEVRLEIDGVAHDEVIDNDGKPFRTTGTDQSRRFRWTGGDWSDSGDIGPPDPNNDPRTCQGVDVSQLATTGGPTWSFGTGGTQRASSGTRSSVIECTFLGTVPTATGGSTTTTLGVRVFNATDASEANGELERAESDLTRKGDINPLTGLGDAAYVSDQGLIVRAGNRVISLTWSQGLSVSERRTKLQAMAIQLLSN